MPSKGKAIFSELYCKGCELCVEVCPKKIIKIDESVTTSKGYHPAHLTDDGCTGCAVCALVCPEAAITVFREKKE